MNQTAPNVSARDFASVTAITMATSAASDARNAALPAESKLSQAIKDMGEERWRLENARISDEEERAIDDALLAILNDKALKGPDPKGPVAEAAVVGRPDELKGQAISAFVTLEGGRKGSDELKNDLRAHVAKEVPV